MYLIDDLQCYLHCIFNAIQNQVLYYCLHGHRLCGALLTPDICIYAFYINGWVGCQWNASPVALGYCLFVLFYASGGWGETRLPIMHLELFCSHYRVIWWTESIYYLVSQMCMMDWGWTKPASPIEPLILKEVWNDESTFMFYQVDLL